MSNTPHAFVYNGIPEMITPGTYVLLITVDNDMNVVRHTVIKLGFATDRTEADPIVATESTDATDGTETDSVTAIEVTETTEPSQDPKRGHSLILPDQDILSALYGDKVKLVDTMRFNLSDKVLSLYNASHRHDTIELPWIRQNSVIIHYCGKEQAVE